MECDDDAALLRAAAAGDDPATTVLVRRYIRPATLLAVQLLGDRDEAEDVVAEAFMIALERASAFRASAPLAPWLYGIVRRVAIRRHRRAFRRRFLTSRWGAEPVESLDAERLLIVRETLDRVDAIVQRLPRMQRQCFELAVYHGFDVTEITHMLGIASSTVRQHIFRARRAVREAEGDDEKTY